MTYSYVLYAGNGSNKNFSFNFPYLDKSHIKTKVDNTQTTEFTWLTNSSIQFTTAPAAGVVIEIYRETPQSAAPVDFTDGSVLLERDLDLLTTFNLYVGQEATDKATRSIAVGSDGAFNALGLRVANAADPVNDQDLVTKKWAETSVSSGVNQAQTAAAEAAAAATTAYNAVAYTKADREAIAQEAADAANSKNVAATNRKRAEDASGTAVAKATEAAASATSANAAAVTAEAARDTAVAAKNDMVTASNTAVAKATEAATSATSALDSKNTAVASATAASGSANLAQNWASSMSLVDGVSFGAKKYASDAAASTTQAGNSAAAAAASATQVGNSVAAAAASATQAGNAETNAVTAKVAAEAARDTALTYRNQASTSATAASNSAATATAAAAGVNLPPIYAGDSYKILQVNPTGTGYTLTNLTPTRSFRNKVINGDMVVNQRGAASYTMTGDGAPKLVRAVDLIQTIYSAGGGQVTVLKETSVVPQGASASLRVTVGVARTAASGEFGAIVVNLEGNTVKDLEWGTSNARSCALSFWIRSSITGSYSVSIRNSDGSRSLPLVFSISQANTWEKKQITLNGETTGTWLKDTGTGISLWFPLLSHSMYHGTANVWQNGNLLGVSSNVQLCNTAGATFYLTDIQFEEGVVATPFERLPYTVELDLCRRYFEKGVLELWSGNVASGDTYFTSVTYGVQKRVPPTVTVLNQSANMNFPNVNPTIGYTGVLSPLIAPHVANGALNSFIASQVANGTGNGLFTFNWEANAEM